MTFPRNDPHEVLVQQIQEALTALGWCVEPMGQELFSATMQETSATAHYPTGDRFPSAGCRIYSPRAHPTLISSTQSLRNVATNRQPRPRTERARDGTQLDGDLGNGCLVYLHGWERHDGPATREVLGEMARSPAGQRVGHAVLVVPGWSHDALGTTALHQPTLKTKALPLSRPRHPTPCQSVPPTPHGKLGLKRAGFVLIRLFGQPHENRWTTTASRCTICAMDPRGSRGAISSGLGQSRERD